MTNKRKDDGRVIQGLKICLSKKNRLFVVFLICLIGFIAYTNLTDFKITIGNFIWESVSNVEYFKKKCGK